MTSGSSPRFADRRDCDRLTAAAEVGGGVVAAPDASTRPPQSPLHLEAEGTTVPDLRRSPEGTRSVSRTLLLEAPL